MKKHIYLDNAATTPMDPEVIDTMVEMMRSNFGNPSSMHFHGRGSKVILEKARKDIAAKINVRPSEIYFTSGGTEADNMIIRNSVKDLDIKRIITSPIEHHAVVHTIEEFPQVSIEYVNLDEKGAVDLKHLEELLSNEDEKTLVCLMHANNELGNLLPLKKVSELCQKYNAFFHSDTVQTMGHYRFDFDKIKIDFATCSAHKFHGPKGVGFVYINSDNKISPMITGGGQERNLRAGTENLHSIIGLAKAFEVAYRNINEHIEYVTGLKKYMIEELEKNIPGISFNGDAKGSSLYTVLNVHFPASDMNEMLLYKLDIAGISSSGGSACSSGSNQGSHVLRSIGANKKAGTSLRFSFSRMNTKEEIDYTIKMLKEFFVE